MKLKVIIAALLLITAVAFANPFIGKWLQNGKLELIVGSTSVVELGDYTYDDNIFTVAGVTWLYCIIDSDHISFVRWMDTPFGPSPAICEWSREPVETPKGDS